jgi:polyhydroxyalkanoate synthesis regulator phasin
MNDHSKGPSLDFNSLCLQIGEVIQGISALGNTIEIRHGQTEKLHDLIREDMATLRRDQRDLEEKLDCVICVMQHDLETIRTGAFASGRSVDELVRAVQELKAPVSEIVALRSRVAGILLGFGLVGSIAVWLAEPLYRWALEQHYLKN